MSAINQIPGLKAIWYHGKCSDPENLCSGAAYFEFENKASLEASFLNKNLDAMREKFLPIQRSDYIPREAGLFVRGFAIDRYSSMSRDIKNALELIMVVYSLMKGIEVPKVLCIDNISLHEINIEDVVYKDEYKPRHVPPEEKKA